MPAIAPTHPYTPSANVAQLKESATIAVSVRAAALRAAGREIIDLGAGQPDFDTPAFIRHAAAQAVEDGATRYTPTAGIPALRAAIARDLTASAAGNVSYRPEQVVVSAGAKQSIFNCCFTLFGPGDEVLVPTPGWTSYFDIVELARATAVAVVGDPLRGLKVGPALLADAATPRTRGLILNSPTNPTGAIYSPDEMRAILALAAEREWWVISDEIYQRLSYEAPAVSAAEVTPDPDRLVVIDGVSKAYAMTGWRIGWSVSTEPLARAMTALQSHTTFGAAAVSQHAALAALTHTEQANGAIREMVDAFRERRDAALGALSGVSSVSCIHPEGAFYLFLDVSRLAPSSDAPGTVFARRLLDEQGVAVVPGAAFNMPGWIRVSYAAPLPQVVEGVRRIVTLAARPLA